MMRCDVLVPMKEIEQCKSRLSSMLSPAVRQAVTQAMLEHVLLALSSAKGVREVTVVGGGLRLRDLSSAHGVHWIPAGGSGLNATLQEALKWALCLKPSIVGIVFGDLPFLRGEDVEGAIQFLEKGRYDCVLAPDVVGTGTNGVFIRKSCFFRPCFGDRSYERHRRDLLQRGFRVGTYRAGGFSRDVDTPQDAFAAWPALRNCLKESVDVEI